MAYNVLIVDDSKSMRKVILKTLQLSGFMLGECLEASNGQEGLQVLEEKWVDLILSDVHMPVLDGIGFIQALKDKGDFRDTPIIFVTTEANEDRLNLLMDLGASGYIRKPFRPEEIGVLLSRIMGDADGFRAGMGTNAAGCDF